MKLHMSAQRGSLLFHHTSQITRGGGKKRGVGGGGGGRTRRNVGTVDVAEGKTLRVNANVRCEIRAELQQPCRSTQ